MSETMTAKALPEKRRLARNVHEGYEVRLNNGTWLTVESVLHITVPLPVSLFTMTNGEEFSVPPLTVIMSRRPAGVSS
jgi:hypothetical protein